jgi:hypothetical protein
VELDAAEAVLGLESSIESDVTDSGDGGGEKAVIHPADELGVSLGELMERTVAKDHASVAHEQRLEPTRFQRIEHGTAPAADPTGAGVAQP